MNLYQQFEVDSKREISGVWIPYGKGEKAPAFLIGRMGGSNKKFGVIHAEREQDREDAKGNEKTLQRIAIEVFIDACVFDWKNVQNRGGTEIPFGRDAAIQLFADLPELFVDLSVKSADREKFLVSSIEADAKN